MIIPLYFAQKNFSFCLLMLCFFFNVNSVYSYDKNKGKIEYKNAKKLRKYLKKGKKVSKNITAIFRLKRFLSKFFNSREKKKIFNYLKGASENIDEKKRAQKYRGKRKLHKKRREEKDDLAGEYRSIPNKKIALSELKISKREPVFKPAERRGIKIKNIRENYKLEVYRVRFRLMGVVKNKIGEIIISGEKFRYNCGFLRYCRELKNIVKEFFTKRRLPPYNRILKGGNTAWKLYKFLLYSNFYNPILSKIEKKK